MTATQKILLIIGCAVFLVILLWLWRTVLSFVKLRKKVKSAYVKLRDELSVLYGFADRVSGMLNAKGADTEPMLRARHEARQAKGAEAKAECDSILRVRLRKLIADYCEMTESAELESELAEIETEIFKARKGYNAIVREHNSKRKRFPDNIAGALFRFKPYKFYTADEAEDTETQ